MATIKTRTAKQAQFLDYISNNPGCNIAELHRAVGHAYAHGAHQFTYATVDRMVRNRWLTRVAPRSGRGVGLAIATES